MKFRGSGGRKERVCGSFEWSGGRGKFVKFGTTYMRPRGWLVEFSVALRAGATRPEAPRGGNNGTHEQLAFRSLRVNDS